MSKISWWLIATAAVALAVMGALFSSAYSPHSPTGSTLDAFTRAIMSRANDLYYLIWPGHFVTIRASPLVQTSHALGLALFCYANDNDGKYPTGKSSTEVFQKLLDGGYITDPAIFYSEELHLPSKRAAVSKKLKPENVCWDVTIPVELNKTNGALPLVFTTGFKINFVPGSSAIPYPPPSPATKDGIAVFYVNNSAAYIHNDGMPDEIVPNVVGVTFKTDGITYVQLSPNGPVP